MKKLLQIIIFSLLPLLSLAQNYACFTNTTHYYTNSNGYLRGTKIDSSKTINGNTVLYPFRSARGSYDNGPLDTTSGSWMSKTIIILPNGDYLFDNYWGDTVLIKTQAELNDEWIIFNDTTDIYYIAKVTDIDTQTVLGNLDSVKEITISAYNNSAPLITDLLNNATILLSKEHGFVRVCDLYMFPLHEPDKTFQNGFDFYFDLSINRSFTPGLEELMFNIVSYDPPNKFSIFNHGIGDILEYGTIDTKNRYSSYTLDEFVSMYATGSEIRYTIKRWVETSIPNPSGPPSKTTTGYIHTFRVDDIYWPMISVPEEWQYNSSSAQNYIFQYLPNDTSFCMSSTKYAAKWVMLDRDGNASYYFCGNSPHYIYKNGLGIIGTYYCYNAPAEFYNMDLIYFKRIKECGFFIPLSTESMQTISKTNVYPNPANDILTIALPEPYMKYRLRITNINGSMVQELNVANNALIDVSNYPNGIYMLSIKSEGNLISNQKFTVVH